MLKEEKATQFPAAVAKGARRDVPALQGTIHSHPIISPRFADSCQDTVADLAAACNFIPTLEPI
jgi:hypothetical protein